MHTVGTRTPDAGDELHVSVRHVIVEVGIRFGRNCPPDLDTVLRYYVGVHHAFERAARDVVAMAKVHGLDGGAR